MQRWRYHSLIIRDLSIADAKLNAEGEKGWELVSVCLVTDTTARAFFKQPAGEGEEIGTHQHEMDLASPSPF